MPSLAEQFENLIDPSTALGAFLISLVAGLVCSFITGWQACKYKNRKNDIEANDVGGSINQDINSDQSNNYDKASFEKTKNSIKVRNVQGDINQDVRK